MRAEQHGESVWFSGGARLQLLEEGLSGSQLVLRASRSARRTEQLLFELMRRAVCCYWAAGRARMAWAARQTTTEPLRPRPVPRVRMGRPHTMVARSS